MKTKNEKYSNPQKVRTPLAQKTSTKRRMVTIHPPVRLVGEPKKTNKRKDARKEDTQNSGKLAIRPDHPRRRIKMKLCVVGGLRYVVIHIKCHPNRLRGYGAVVGQKWPFPITLASDLYSSCTTVQAVIIIIIILN